ncbi:hypothetical protein B0H13DRAFT_1854724 [Mycena leptocephala]|nr:hypothetical protein B0H13DRAFT_1854724 [Mycena leptocephala]
MSTPAAAGPGSTPPATAAPAGDRSSDWAAAPEVPSKAYAPGFFPVQQTPVGVSAGVDGGRKMSGSGSPTPRYGGGFAGSQPAFQNNRYQSNQHRPATQPISHPNSGSARGAGGGQKDSRVGGKEFDVFHDGTLASLDLDREREREFMMGTPHGARRLESLLHASVDGWMEGSGLIVSSLSLSRSCRLVVSPQGNPRPSPPPTRCATPPLPLLRKTESSLE